MQVSVKFFEKVFTKKEDETSKQVYLEVCKWIAQHLIGKTEIGETFWKIEKEGTADSPVFKLQIFCMMDAGDAKDSFCERCKTMHAQFYINENYNCSRCNLITYINNVDSKLKIKKQFRKERIEYLLSK